MIMQLLLEQKITENQFNAIFQKVCQAMENNNDSSLANPPSGSNGSGLAQFLFESIRDEFSVMNASMPEKHSMLESLLTYKDQKQAGKSHPLPAELRFKTKPKLGESQPPD